MFFKRVPTTYLNWIFMKHTLTSSLTILTSFLILSGCVHQPTQVDTKPPEIIQATSSNPLSIPIVSDGDLLFIKDDKDVFETKKNGYELNSLDKALINAPNLPNKFRTFTSANGDKLSLPSYKMRRIQKSGVNEDIGIYWKMIIQELSLDVFQIQGTNSKGEKINQKCFSLEECFSII